MDDEDDMDIVICMLDAASRGDLESMRALVRHDRGLLEAEYEGYTTLGVASENGQARAVCYLLDEGADINRRSSQEWSPLDSACVYGQVHVVDLLLARGADAVTPDPKGRTALMCALGEVPCAWRLLAHGCGDVDQREAYRGETALHCAARDGYAHAAQLLLEAGADPFITDRRGMTPLQTALRKGRPTCAALLQEWERDYNLHRARRLSEVAQELPRARPSGGSQEPKPAPAYINRRMMGVGVLPSVAVGRIGGRGKQTRVDRLGGSMEEQVVRYVLGPMKTELFKEWQPL